MERNTKKASKLLLILVIGWVLLWILHNLLVGDWFSRFFNHSLLFQHASPKLCTLVQGFSCYTGILSSHS